MESVLCFQGHLVEAKGATVVLSAFLQRAKIQPKSVLDIRTCSFPLALCQCTKTAQQDGRRSTELPDTGFVQKSSWEFRLGPYNLGHTQRRSARGVLVCEGSVRDLFYTMTLIRRMKFPILVVFALALSRYTSQYFRAFKQEYQSLPSYGSFA